MLLKLFSLAITAMHFTDRAVQRHSVSLNSQSVLAANVFHELHADKVQICLGSYVQAGSLNGT